MALENTFLPADENGLRFQLFFENAQDIVLFVRQSDGRILEANPSAIQAYGRSRPELLTLSFPDLLARGNTALGLSELAAVDSGSIRYETLHRRKDGSLFPVEVDTSGVTLYGERVIVTTIRDITERRRLEAQHVEMFQQIQRDREHCQVVAERVTRLQAVTAALSQAVSPEQVARVIVEQGAAELGARAGVMTVLDETGRFLNVVHAVGYPEHLIRQWQNLPVTSDTPAADAVRKRKPVFRRTLDLEKEYTQMPQEMRELARAIARLPLIATERVLGTVGFDFDQERELDEEERAFMLALANQCAQALERSRLYQVEREARQAAEAAIHQRDQFLAVASHELRTPLTAMMGYAEMLGERALNHPDLDELDLRAIETIQRQTRRLNRMIETLLDVSRIESGLVHFERVPVDVCLMLKRIVYDLEPGLFRHHLRTELPPEPVLVQGDEFRLEQVMHNLIQNAIKYSPQGGDICVEVRSNHAAHIRVSDKGIGIPDDARPALFDRFYRASNAQNMHINGMGIGLYLVKEIVTLHGGEIHVESQEGRGSTFEVTLPLAVTAPVSTPAVAG